MKNQDRRDSFIESITNTLVGFVVTIIFSPLVYYVCSVPISKLQIGLTTLLFTILSIARNYVVRRYFNKNKEDVDLDKIISQYKSSEISEFKSLEYFIKNKHYKL